MTAFIFLYTLNVFSFVGGTRIAFITPPRGERVRPILTALVALSFGGMQIFGLTKSQKGLAELGYIFLAISFILFWWTALTIRHDKLNAISVSSHIDHVRSSGPFYWIRHPFYTSYITSYVAAAFGSFSMYTLAPAIIMTAFYILTARSEEKSILNSSQADNYRRYKNQTGFLIPNPLSFLRGYG